MINIFYDSNYFKRKRIFFTKQLKYSKFIVPYYKFCYKLNLPVNSNLIFSGPQQRINHLLKTFRKNEYVFNKITHDNHYIVQFDEFGKKQLNRILNKKRDGQKVIVGPLMDIPSTKQLIDITNQFTNVKILVASKHVKYNLIEEMGLNVQPKNIFVCPSGIVSNKKITLKNQERSGALIYFKKRNPEELDFVVKMLESRNIKYKLVHYGNYKNKDLNKLIDNSKFGILLCRTESQGFAIQNMMARNLPLYVWDMKINRYGGYKLSGTSVSMWNEKCGRIADNKKEFEEYFDVFINNLEKYSPEKFVKKELTYEKFEENMLNLFSSF
mgnify:CR=1 FL=1